MLKNGFWPANEVGSGGSTPSVALPSFCTGAPDLVSISASCAKSLAAVDLRVTSPSPITVLCPGLDKGSTCFCRPIASNGGSASRVNCSAKVLIFLRNWASAAIESGALDSLACIVRLTASFSNPVSCSPESLSSMAASGFSVSVSMSSSSWI